MNILTHLDLSRSADHIAKECPEPRSAADVECRRCNQSTATSTPHAMIC